MKGTREPFEKRAGRWVSAAIITLKAGWGTAAISTGALLLALGAQDTDGWAFRSGAALSVLGVTASLFFNAPTVRRALKDAEASATKADGYAKSLGRVLGGSLMVALDETGCNGHRARISIYRHQGGDFILLERNSKSPKLFARGRDRYPDDQGIIGEAWSAGRAIVRNLPADRLRWNSKCTDSYDIPQSVAENLSMHSRSFIALRVSNDGVDPRHLGVLVIESEDSEGVTSQMLDDLLVSPIWTLLNVVLLKVVDALGESDGRPVSPNPQPQT